MLTDCPKGIRGRATRSRRHVALKLNPHKMSQSATISARPTYVRCRFENISSTSANGRATRMGATCRGCVRAALWRAAPSQERRVERIRTSWPRSINAGRAQRSDVIVGRQGPYRFRRSRSLSRWLALVEMCLCFCAHEGSMLPIAGGHGRLGHPPSTSRSSVEKTRGSQRGIEAADPAGMQGKRACGAVRECTRVGGFSRCALTRCVATRIILGGQFGPPKIWLHVLAAPSERFERSAPCSASKCSIR
jgi:hypothetical protein